MKEPKLIIIRTSAGETWTEPVPEQVSHEIDACVAVDVLRMALTAVRTGRLEAAKPLNELPADADVVAVRAAAEAQVARLLQMIDSLDTAGQAIIDAVNIMLNI